MRRSTLETELSAWQLKQILCTEEDDVVKGALTLSEELLFFKQLHQVVFLERK